MADKFRRLSNMEDRILSCVAVGDCRGALKGPYKEPILEATCPMRDHGPGFESFFARGRFTISRALLDGKIEPSEGLAEVVFQCTLCGACREVCNNMENPCMEVNARRYIEDHVEIWEGLRADLVDAGVAPMQRHKELFKHLRKEHNPYKEPHSTRKNWIPKEFMGLKEDCDTLFFVGCTSAYRLNDIPLNFLKIAQETNLDLKISDDEWCCGSVNLRTGTEDKFMKLANHNFELFGNSKVETIVTTCAGCYKTLKIDYPKYLDNWEFQVKHSIEMIDDALNEGIIQIKKRIDGIITYHDPCHLGRHSGIYDAPRNVIDAIRKDGFIEMRRNRNYSYCCGAGGGVKSSFPELALEIAQDRVQEAENTGAEYLTTTCPFCINNLSQAAKDLNSSIKVVDLLDLVARAL
jgi:heterodisulfide reductase subunit D